MTTVNMLEAKSNLSKLVEAVESGAEDEIIIARNGKPVARLVPLAKAAPDVSRRLGIAEGQFGDWTREMADEWDRDSKAMWAEWLKEPLDPDERPEPAKVSKRRTRAR